MANTKVFLDSLEYTIDITERQLLERKDRLVSLAGNYNGNVNNVTREIETVSELEVRLKTLREVRELTNILK